MIYCTIDVPNVDDQAHSNYAQEIVHNVLQQVLPYMGIEPTEPVQAGEAVTAAAPEAAAGETTQETEGAAQ